MKRIVLFFAVALLLVGYGFSSWGQTKTVWVPKTGDTQEASEVDQEILDMTDEDPILLESFQDLAQAKFGEHLPYIIARVEAGGVTRYYDAHSLNNYLFGFLTGLSNSLNQYKDAQRTPIDRLDYFTLNNPQEEAFTYLCSFENVVDRLEHWRNYFYQNQEMALNPEEKLAAAQDILGARHRGSYYLATEYLKDVAAQQENLQAACEAEVILGDLYYHGLRAGERWIIPRSYKQAAGYWQTVTDNELADVHDRANAWLHLGKIYQQGGDNFPPRYAKAYECYRNAAGYADLYDEAAAGIAKIEGEHRMEALQEIALEKLRLKADKTNTTVDQNYRLNILCDIERALRPEGSAEQGGGCSLQ